VLLNMCVIAIFCTAALVLPLPLSICSQPNQAAYAKRLTSPLPRHPTKARLTKPPQLTVSKFPKPETAKSLKPPPLPARKPEARSPLPPSGSPRASVLPPATAKHYVVLDTVGNCAVIDSKPSAGLKIIGYTGGYTSLKSANKALKNSKAKCKDVVGRETLTPPLPARKPEARSPLPPSSPSTSVLPPVAVYVVRDAVGNCAVVDFQPSASTGLKIIEKSDYANCKDVIEKEALIGVDEQGAEAKFKAAQAKAEKLGGVHTLTPEDIEGLSIEQIKQLRGY
jgi:hypothetical protein